MCSFIAFISELSLSKADFVRGINSSSLFFKFLIIWRNLSLEFDLKVICRSWLLIGKSKHITLNGYWSKLSHLIMVLLIKRYQLFFWFFKTFLIWRNPSLEFFLKVIFRRWVFIIDGKNFIFDVSWWKLYQFIMVFFLELYQFIFLFFKNLIRWINLVLGCSFKVIFRRWIFRGNSKHFICNGLWWRLSQCIMVFFHELYQLSSLFFITLIWWRNILLEFYIKVIFRRRMFRGESEHFMLDGSWWGLFQLHHGVIPWTTSILLLVFSTLIRWRNISLELMFRVDDKPWIWNGSWCEISQFIMVL